MGQLFLATAAVAGIPLGVLVSAVRDRSLRRRDRFWLRLTAFVVCVCLPDLLFLGGSAIGLVGGDAVMPLLAGLLWGLLLLALAPSVLFQGPGFDPGTPPDDDGGGPGHGDDRPRTPTLPIGGLPLPDAEQSSVRLRGPRPGRRPLERRPAREPTRTPSRL